MSVHPAQRTRVHAVISSPPTFCSTCPAEPRSQSEQSVTASVMTVAAIDVCFFPKTGPTPLLLPHHNPSLGSARTTLPARSFGLARYKLRSKLSTHTIEAGTTPYLPPEVFDQRVKHLTDRSDVYSLGM